MDRINALSAGGLILLLIVVQANSAIINDLVASRSPVYAEESDLLPLQNEEKWLLIPVHFKTNVESQDSVSATSIIDIMEGEKGASEYIRQASAGRSSLSYYVSAPITTLHEMSWYGTDNPERDYRVQDLVVEVFQTIDLDNLEEFDLNNDGILDRVILLIGEEAQETGGGPDSIWSHFSHLENPVDKGSITFDHYAISSTKSGLGTIVHEVLHQMGGLDLYDVHGDSPTRDWNGVGDWGIMASGNWNGAGETPALPSASTLTLIDPLREVGLVNTEIKKTYILSPYSENGSVYQVRISETESIWLTFRNGEGFDSGLPGSGILVEYQDTLNGDPDGNMLNSNPLFPWSYIIESDGNDALILGDNDGEYTDTFQVDSFLGSTGVRVRDSTGKLVPWTIEITDVNNEFASFEFNPGNNTLEAMFPRAPIILLPDQTLNVDITLYSPCILEIESTWSQNTQDRIQDTVSYDAGNYSLMILDNSETNRAKGMMNTEIVCINEDGSTNQVIDVSSRWYTVQHKLDDKLLEFDVDSTGVTDLNFEVGMVGDGSVTYSLVIDGPASQIVTSSEAVTISPSENAFPLKVSPNGLLSPGMIARGEIILIDNNGLESRVPFILYTENRLQDLPIIGWLSTPANGISIALLLLLISTSKNMRRHHEGSHSRSGNNGYELVDDSPSNRIPP